MLLPQQVIDGGGALSSISFVVLGMYLIFAAVIILLTRGRLGLASAAAGRQVAGPEAGMPR